MSSSGRLETMNDGMERDTALVCFAVPDESRLFTAHLAKRRVVRGGGKHPLPTVFGELLGRPITVVHTGVGDSANCARTSRPCAG